MIFDGTYNQFMVAACKLIKTPKVRGPENRAGPADPTSPKVSVVMKLRGDRGSLATRP